MRRLLTIVFIGAIIMSVFNILGEQIYNIFNINGNNSPTGYNKNGDLVFPDLPIPTGDLNASSQIPLPDIYNNGHGWSCTGLAYDDDSFLVGDIGKELPSSQGFASQIVRVSTDFQTVIGTIPLYQTFPNMEDVQGITVDNDDTIWFCSSHENLIRHIDNNGNSIGSLSVTQPTGIAYSYTDNSFWVLTYSNKIVHLNKNGTVLESYDFAYSDTLDQCFLDEARGYLYITAGANYQSRNNIYLFNTKTHEQSITCTVDSYSVEGIWIGTDRMIILNDGYYHDALVKVNQANIYSLD